MDNKAQSVPGFAENVLLNQTARPWRAERPLAERNCGTGNLGSFRCACRAAAKTRVAVLTCEKSSDKRLLPKRHKSEEE